MRWLGVALAAITAVLMAVAVLLSLDAPPADTVFGVPLYSAFSAIAAAAVGALILWRSPTHAVGWTFAGGALASMIEKAADQYGSLATLRRSDLPGGDWAAWLGSWIWFVAIVLYAVVLPIVFPTGRPPTARWRIGLAAGGVALLGLLGAVALRTGPLEVAPGVQNPAGVLGPEQAALVQAIASPLLVLSIGIAIAAMTVRYRRSSGVERQQLKWLAYALALFAISFVVSAVLRQVGGGFDVSAIGILLAATLIPVAAGIAILRHRLYDIDILINRTLVYAAVSAALLGTYFAAVVTLQTLLRPFTSGSELAVAGSTLAVVALFAPLRRRIQGGVDRRFYRSRYDAARTLEAFSVRMRDQVDIDAVRGEVLDVVRTTVQPAHASVWLRERTR